MGHFWTPKPSNLGVRTPKMVQIWTISRPIMRCIRIVDTPGEPSSAVGSLRGHQGPIRPGGQRHLEPPEPPAARGSRPPKRGPKWVILGVQTPNPEFVIDWSSIRHPKSMKSGGSDPQIGQFSTNFGTQNPRSGAGQDPGIPLYGSSMVPEGLPGVQIGSLE